MRERPLKIPTVTNPSFFHANNNQEIATLTYLSVRVLVMSHLEVLESIITEIKNHPKKNGNFMLCEREQINANLLKETNKTPGGECWFYNDGDHIAFTPLGYFKYKIYDLKLNKIISASPVIDKIYAYTNECVLRKNGIAKLVENIHEKIIEDSSLTPQVVFKSGISEISLRETLRATLFDQLIDLDTNQVLEWSPISHKLDPIFLGPFIEKLLKNNDPEAALGLFDLFYEKFSTGGLYELLRECIFCDSLPFLKSILSKLPDEYKTTHLKDKKEITLYIYERIHHLISLAVKKNPILATELLNWKKRIEEFYPEYLTDLQSSQAQQELNDQSLKAADFYFTAINGTVDEFRKSWDSAGENLKSEIINSECSQAAPLLKTFIKSKKQDKLEAFLSCISTHIKNLPVPPDDVTVMEEVDNPSATDYQPLVILFKTLLELAIQTNNYEAVIIINTAATTLFGENHSTSNAARMSFSRLLPELFTAASRSSDSRIFTFFFEKLSQAHPKDKFSKAISLSDIHHPAVLNQLLKYLKELTKKEESNMIFELIKKLVPKEKFELAELILEKLDDQEKNRFLKISPHKTSSPKMVAWLIIQAKKYCSAEKSSELVSKWLLQHDCSIFITALKNQYIPNLLSFWENLKTEDKNAIVLQCGDYFEDLLIYNFIQQEVNVENDDISVTLKPI